MTEDNARRLANLMLGAAVIGAACYIVRTPALRTLAWRLTLTTVTSTLPSWFSREIRQAWADTAGPRDMMIA